jgi:hypothetical protein
MKRINIQNTNLPVFCCGIEGRAAYVKEVWAEAGIDMAQGEAECGNCDCGFHTCRPQSRQRALCERRA